MFFPTQLRPAAILLTWLATHAVQAGPVEVSPEVITLPVGFGGRLFADIEGRGRSDLLVLDRVEKKLRIYHQRSDGFSKSPDQSIALPPQTAWTALCDVDAHPGLELLFSTATGIVYARQNAGVFESELHTLIQSSQVFSNFDFPILTLLSTNKAGTNDLIPVISAGQAVLYHRNSAYAWSPETPLALDARKTTWHVNRVPWWSGGSHGDRWTLGPNPMRSLSVQQSFQANSDPKQDEEAANDAIRKITEDFKKDDETGYSKTNRVDVNGDGRKDLVLWHVSGKTDIKTDLYVFLRGADHKLPERPTQILHCRGFPIPTGSTYEPSPFIDLKGDGAVELVLLELKSSFTSVNGAVETALSHGLDWALTIRTFQDGGFSRSPAASVPVTGILPAEAMLEWPIFIMGDFNGDGRPDLFFRRSQTHWNIFFSTADGRWFAPQPAMAFEAPDRGYIGIENLNGAGPADVVWYEPDDFRLSIYMSPLRQAKGKNP